MRASRTSPGFFIEKSLSIDNVFVISLIFSYFAIPRKYQYRALVWGIIGVIVLRGIMIAVGAALVQEYAWCSISSARSSCHRHQDADRAETDPDISRRTRWCASCASTCG